MFLMAQDKKTLYDLSKKMLKLRAGCIYIAKFPGRQEILVAAYDTNEDAELVFNMLQGIIEAGKREIIEFPKKEEMPEMRESMEAAKNYTAKNSVEKQDRLHRSQWNYLNINNKKCVRSYVVWRQRCGRKDFYTKTV